MFGDRPAQANGIYHIRAINSANVNIKEGQNVSSGTNVVSITIIKDIKTSAGDAIFDNCHMR
jgi:hypothetical protein